MRLFLAFATVFSYKIVSNLSRMVMVRYYQDKYTSYISDKNCDFTMYTYSIKKLFNRANVKEGAVTVATPIGGGYTRTSKALLFENMGVLDYGIIAMMNSCFSKAYGTYQTRLLECFSPLYWIECVIFLPQKILAYLGVKDNGILTKSIQLLYWLSLPLITVFRSQIYTYIAELISKVQ